MIKKLFSIVLLVSLYSIVFHFHSDFSYHSDCPACVFEVDDEKTLTTNVSDTKNIESFQSKYFFSLKENQRFHTFPRVSFQRAPPKN